MGSGGSGKVLAGTNNVSTKPQGAIRQQDSQMSVLSTCPPYQAATLGFKGFEQLTT
jgi:hypothetical protein